MKLMTYLAASLMMGSLAQADTVTITATAKTDGVSFTGAGSFDFSSYQWVQNPIAPDDSAVLLTGRNVDFIGPQRAGQLRAYDTEGVVFT